MRTILYSILFLGIAPFCLGQPAERGYKEAIEQFATRYIPADAQLLPGAIETKWNGKPVVIAFFEQTYKLSVQDDPGQEEYKRVIGKIFFQTDSNLYNQLIIDSIESEGGAPKVEAVFFANADKDKNKELVVLVSWPQLHADVRGTLYGTYIYDDLLKTSEKKLCFKRSISQKLSGGCECTYENGKTKKAKYKKAADIRSALKRLGYK